MRVAGRMAFKSTDCLVFVSVSWLSQDTSHEVVASISLVPLILLLWLTVDRMYFLTINCQVDTPKYKYTQTGSCSLNTLSQCPRSLPRWTDRHIYTHPWGRPTSCGCDDSFLSLKFVPLFFTVIYTWISSVCEKRSKSKWCVFKQVSGW